MFRWRDIRSRAQIVLEEAGSHLSSREGRGQLDSHGWLAKPDRRFWPPSCRVALWGSEG